MKPLTLILARIQTVALVCLLGSLVSAPVARAQDDLFAPAVTVNNEVITHYELRQRILFLQILRQPGDIPKMAKDGLIEDRLRADAAKKLEVETTPEEISAGMAEFASRANLTTEEFVKAIGEGGVEAETFRDFVEAGILWRGVVRARFGGRVNVSEVEIDRAIADGAASGGEVRVLLSEIVIPTGGATNAMEVATRLKASIKTPTAFAIAAKSYSKADSASNGGALNWIPAPALPKEVAAQILALKPGEITDPIVVSGAVELFLLRDISQSAGETQGASEVDYARFFAPVGTDMAAVVARLDTCDDLNIVARGLPAESLQRETVAESALPGDVKGPIAGLDAGETVVLPGASGAAQLVMLCSRQPHSDVPPSRSDVSGDLLNRKLGLLAASYMEELRSEAIIREQ
jgi:peptidyl-prolyl cis-trans isomerase SurA